MTKIPTSFERDLALNIISSLMFRFHGKIPISTHGRELVYLCSKGDRTVIYIPTEKGLPLPIVESQRLNGKQ
jgi:hypothetical protein